MHTPRIAAVLIGGLFLAPASFAQTGAAPAGAARTAGGDIAYARPAPRGDLLVFLQPGNIVPDSALPALVRAAAAARAGRTVEVVGGAATADIVKRELLREGAPARSVVVSPARPADLPHLDPLDDTASRAVTLRF